MLTDSFKITLQHFGEWLSHAIYGKLFVLFCAFTFIWLLAFIIKRRMVGKFPTAQNRFRTLKLIRILRYLLGAVAIIFVFRDDLGGLSVAVGVAGAGIAFALQEVIASAAGWLAIIFSGFYEVGDRVQLGGIKGDVIDIGVLRTTLMELGQWVDGDLYNGRIVRVANSFVFKEPVFNYSGEFPFLWDEIKIPIKYGSDYELARRLIRQTADELLISFAKEAKTKWSGIVDKYLIEPAETDPMITLTANDNWVEFTLRYTVAYRSRRTTKDALFSRILQLFAASKNRVEIASATQSIVGIPELVARIKRD